MLGISLAAIAACWLAVYVGATVQSSIGIGLGMIAAPVLALTDPGFVPAAIVVVVLPMSIAVAAADRDHILTRDVGLALLGRIPGVIVAGVVVASISDRVLGLIVAGSVLLAVVASLAGRIFRTTPAALAVAGAASGFTGTATGVGGPPMALVYQRSDPATMRATLSAFFSIGTLLSLVALVLAGKLGTRQWQLAALLFPAVVAGWITARLLRHRLTPTVVRPAVLVICTVAALALVVESV
jgi:uncharacterized membrane protein YfcA